MQEQNYGTANDTQYGLQYALDAGVHNLNAATQPRSQAKRYFTTLSLSTTGSTFQQAKFQIDAAATCNTMSHTTLRSLLPDAQINRSPYLPYPYGNSKPRQPIGQVELGCEKAEKYETLVFQILPDTLMGPKPAILSGIDSERLGLIKVQADEIHSLSSTVEASGTVEPSQPIGDENTSGTSAPRKNTEPTTQCNHLQQIHEITTDQCHPSPSPSPPIMVTSNRRLPPLGSLTKGKCTKSDYSEYSDSFEGIGNLGPPVHFQVDEHVRPVQMPIHRIPVAKCTREKEALDKYTAEGIIAKVSEPTSWSSNELIRETPKKFRVCIDPSQTINKAIQRPIYQMPTLNEEFHRLSAAKCFSLVNVKEGFLHIPLNDESSWMTTMHTSYGRYRWLRLPFGITSAPEEFQMRLKTALDGLDGIVSIADDILVFGEGNDYAEAGRDHDRRFIALMERCHHKNIKLKLQFKLKEVKFMGAILTDQGMKPDPNKIAAIIQLPKPQDKPALLRFIGMVNYLSPFCENLSSEPQPLRMLTQTAVPFIWSDAQDQAFNKAKQLIASAPVLAYYDLRKPIILQTDVSDYAVGGALLQPNNKGYLQPVAFNSSSMNPTEQRYSQIEKECLAICHTFQKFDHWLYGKHDIEVHTNHQPLETIMKKPLNKAPARQQRMSMVLHRYRFQVSYRKGPTLYLADTLSRAPLTLPVAADVTSFDVFRVEMQHLGQERNPGLTENTERRIQKETSKDETLKEHTRMAK